MACVGVGIVSHRFQRDLGFQAVLLLVAGRARRPAPARTRTCVTGFQVWMIQRRNLVAVRTRSGSSLRSPSSTGGPKRARLPLSISKRMLTC